MREEDAETHSIQSDSWGRGTEEGMQGGLAYPLNALCEGDRNAMPSGHVGMSSLCLIEAPLLFQLGKASFNPHGETFSNIHVMLIT